jgi:hypothetical protein
MGVREETVVVYTRRDGTRDRAYTQRLGMSDLLGRASLRAAAALLSCGLFAAAPLHVDAQADDDAVAESKLGDRKSARKSRRRQRSWPRTAPESAATGDTTDDEADEGEEAESETETEAPPATPAERDPAPAGDGDEIIADPELESAGAGAPADNHGWGDVVPGAENTASSSAASTYDPLANTGIAHLELIGQFGADLRHEGDLEDAYETRLRFDAEVEFRRSRKLRLSVGLRSDLLWAVPAAGDDTLAFPATETLPARNYSQFEQDRFELDLLPLSAFIDVTPAAGFHLRLGTQPVSMARMDFYSPIDILAAFDLRGQPKLSPGSGRLSQPAVRIDWDLGSWATLQVIYLPWFMPNLARPNRDRFVAGVLGTGGTTTRHQFEDLVDPSNQTRAAESGVRYVGPAPDFSTPQAQARLNMRGSGFEVAVSGGTALEKLPSIYLTPYAEDAIRNLPGADNELAGVLVKDGPVVDVAYHRYVLVGLDGSLDVSPFTIGFELAYSPSRHIVAATADASHLPQPNVSVPIRNPDVNADPADPGNVLDKSIRKGVQVIQGALHLEYLRGESLVLGVEAFFVKTPDLPYDSTRDWWGFIPGKGLYAGGLLGLSYRPNPDANRWRFDLSLVSLVGPSLIAMPQIEYRLLDNFYVNVAAQIFEGPKQGVLQGGAQNVNAGSLYSGYDQVMLGFRYTP